MIWRALARALFLPLVFPLRLVTVVAVGAMPSSGFGRARGGDKGCEDDPEYDSTRGRATECADYAVKLIGIHVAPSLRKRDEVSAILPGSRSLANVTLHLGVDEHNTYESEHDLHPPFRRAGEYQHRSRGLPGGREQELHPIRQA